jgi:hypothetical protein
MSGNFIRIPQSFLSVGRLEKGIACEDCSGIRFGCGVGGSMRSSFQTGAEANLAGYSISTGFFHLG